jgi:hypothetical protein
VRTEAGGRPLVAESAAGGQVLPRMHCIPQQHLFLGNFLMLHTVLALKYSCSTSCQYVEVGEFARDVVRSTVLATWNDRAPGHAVQGAVRA